MSAPEPTAEHYAEARDLVDESYVRLVAHALAAREARGFERGQQSAIVASLTSTESTSILAPVGPAEVWVFGCFGNGHCLYTMGRLPMADRADELTAARRTLDTAVAAREIQTEGAIVRCRSVPLPPGWSFVSWWDRKGDPRHGSHTGILARGTWTDADLIAAGRRIVPWAFRVGVE